MRYGATNSPLRPLLDEVNVLGRLGLDYIEITMDAPLAHHTVIQEQKQALLAAFKHHNLSLVCHLPTFVSTADLTESIREASIQETIRSLETAADLGAEKVVLHPSFIHGLGAAMRALSEQLAMDALVRIMAVADRLKMCVCLENMFPRALHMIRPSAFDPVFDKFPHLRLTLDTGHAHLAGGTDLILAFIDRFGDRIGHFHASDNKGREDDHLPIGAGTIDFARVVAALKAAGYDDTTTMEVFTDDREYLRISRQKLEALFSR